MAASRVIQTRLPRAPLGLVSDQQSTLVRRPQKLFIINLEWTKDYDYEQSIRCLNTLRERSGNRNLEGTVEEPYKERFEGLEQ